LSFFVFVFVLFSLVVYQLLGETLDLDSLITSLQQGHFTCSSQFNSRIKQGVQNVCPQTVVHDSIVFCMIGSMQIGQLFVDSVLACALAYARWISIKFLRYATIILSMRTSSWSLASHAKPNWLFVIFDMGLDASLGLEASLGARLNSKISARFWRIYSFKMESTAFIISRGLCSNKPLAPKPSVRRCLTNK